jgi:hypothetical protein
MSERLTDPQRNALLRRVDWRFLLHQTDAPEVRDWAFGTLSEATRLTARAAAESAAGVDLVVLNDPNRGRLAAARDALRPGGEVYCEWRLPRPGGVKRARRVLRAVGFDEIRVLWPWPPPWLQAPQFWLPVDAPEAIRQFVATRPAATSLWQRGGRRALPTAAGRGAIAPVCALARRPQAGRPRPVDPLSELLDGHGRAAPGGAAEPSWALLTGGRRTISKVIGVPLGAGTPSEIVIKFARVPEADASLRHEADVLSALADSSPIRGAPRVLATGRRCARVAVAESAIRGVSLLSRLTPETFSELASAVTTLLIELAGTAEPQPRQSWDARLVSGPLQTFSRLFAAALDAPILEAAQRRLATLGPLPLCCEHRDCSPWNLVVTPAGQTALLDWESAEPQGLPAIDLIYFLTNAAFMLERALDSGRTRETYRRLLDPGSSLGRIAAGCMERYCRAVGVDSGQLPALRTLCWIVHARSDHAHATADAAGPPTAHALAHGTFFGLLDEELRVPRP